MLQDFMPNKNGIFFTWHICPLSTYTLYLVHSFSLCTLWDHCVQLFIAFAKHLTSPRKRYRKTVPKANKKAPPKIDLILMFALPFTNLPAGMNSHPCSVVCFFWLPVSLEHLNSWILCKPTFIWSHCVLIYGHFQDECAKECFSLMVIIYWLTSQNANMFASYSFFCLLKKSASQFNGYCHNPRFLIL